MIWKEWTLLEASKIKFLILKNLLLTVYISVKWKVVYQIIKTTMSQFAIQYPFHKQRSTWNQSSTNLFLVCAQQFAIIPVLQFAWSLGDGQGGVEDVQLAWPVSWLESIQACLDHRAENRLRLPRLTKHYRDLGQQAGGNNKSKLEQQFLFNYDCLYANIFY